MTATKAAIPHRTVSADKAMAVLDLVSAGDMTWPEAMWLLFPEEAAVLYPKDRWVYLPDPTKLGAGKGSARQ